MVEVYQHTSSLQVENLRSAISLPKKGGRGTSLTEVVNPLRASGKYVSVSGPKLAALRDENFLTQEQLAPLVGMSVRGISLVEGKEHARIYRKRIPALAAAMKLTPEQVLERIRPNDRISPKYEITLSDDDGNIIKLPDDLIEGLVAIAKADGRDFLEWFEEYVTKKASDARGSLAKIGSQTPSPPASVPGAKKAAKDIRQRGQIPRPTNPDPDKPL